MSAALQPLLLFVSHASADADLAKAVVQLIEKAVKLPARQIRCTSVPGYKLPVGADFEEFLRREIFDSKGFVALLTPTSMQSQYVLFELGARWGAKRHLAPVLARGMTAGQLREPISGLNALELTTREGVVQFVQDLADFLGVPLEPMASFQEAVAALVEAASAEIAIDTSSEPPDVVLSEDEIRILQMLIELRPTPGQVAKVLSVPKEKALFYLARLERLKLVGSTWNRERGDMAYYLEQGGREVLISKGLL